MASFPEQATQYTRTLWRGTLVVNALLLLAAGFYAPQWLPPLLQGMAIGLLYLVTLSANAQKPGRQYAQVAISLTRVAITAYAVVCLAQWQPFAQAHLRPELAAVLVITGCFSYKGVVAVGALLHILRGLKKQPYGTPALDR